MVGSPLPEFGYEIDVLNIVPVVLKPLGTRRVRRSRRG
jgi:hypothetical protein